MLTRDAAIEVLSMLAFGWIEPFATRSTSSTDITTRAWDGDVAGPDDPLSKSLDIECFDIYDCQVAETVEPIGLFVSRRARAVSRAFEATLISADGSLATWLVLASLQGGLHQSQREIADELGVEGPTLTHHLNRMESAGLVTRTRNPSNRRMHDVTMTAGGELAFLSLVGVVREFDRQLRAGFSDRELATLRRLLQRLADNATATRNDPEEGR